MKLKVTDLGDGTSYVTTLDEMLKDNVHDPETHAELCRLARGETSVEVGWQVMSHVERIDLAEDGTELPADRVLCECRSCDRIFGDPHDGKCPYCFSRYLKLADLKAVPA